MRTTRKKVWWKKKNKKEMTANILAQIGETVAGMMKEDGLRILAVTQEVCERIDAVLDYARKNPITKERFAEAELTNTMFNGVDKKAHAMLVPVGYACIFTYDELEKGWTRHLAVEIIDGDDGEMVSHGAMKELAKLFGFVKPDFNENVQAAKYDAGDGRWVVHAFQFLSATEITALNLDHVVLAT